MGRVMKDPQQNVLIKRVYMRMMLISRMMMMMIQKCSQSRYPWYCKFDEILKRVFNFGESMQTQEKYCTDIG